MSSERLRIHELLTRSSLTDDDKRWLIDYLNRADTPELRELLLEKFAEDLAGEINELPNGSSEKMLANIHRSIDAIQETKVISIFRRRHIAAACVLVFATGLFFLLKQNNTQNNFQVVAKPVRTDVAAPKGNRAAIILANGQQVLLDSDNRGVLAMQGDTRIEKSGDGKISYHGSALQNVYNTLLNPRGSKPVELTLSDGSKVWLNSESSIRYPVSFAGLERMVEVTGEAYFEVEKIYGSPFRVAVAGKGTIDVLGTHFNVNSYADENLTNITLLEGSIRLTLPASGTALTQVVNIVPGQQASYGNDKNQPTQVAVKNKVDLNAVMAWKNGYFNFDNSSLQMVMRQLARWYNIRISYEGKIAARMFGGEMQRDLNLSEVLKLLEKNNVHFSIQNDELIVRP